MRRSAPRAARDSRAAEREIVRAPHLRPCAAQSRSTSAAAARSRAPSTSLPPPESAARSVPAPPWAWPQLFFSIRRFARRAASVLVRETQHVGASVGTVPDPRATLPGPDVLSRRPGQQRISVQVAAGDRVAQILALGVDLKAPPEAVVKARRDPVERIRDRRPSRNLGALIAGNREARLVVPVDVRAPRPLLVEQSDGEGGRGRRIDGPHEVAELVVAAGSGRREVRMDPEAILHDVLPGELYAGVGALGAIRWGLHGPQEGS